MSKNLTKEAEEDTLKLAKKYGFEQELIKNCYEVLRNSVGEFKKVTKGTFLHFDLLPSHVFAEGDQLTGIIDFGGSVGGDPVQDFVRWHYYYDESFEGLVEGYENKEILNNGFEEKLALYTLFHGLWLFAYHDRVKNADLIPNDQKNFEWALEILE